jgi:hypothetical protein
VEQTSTEPDSLLWLWILLAVVGGLCSSLALGLIVAMLLRAKKRDNAEANEAPVDEHAVEMVSARDEHHSFDDNSTASMTIDPPFPTRLAGWQHFFFCFVFAHVNRRVD